MFDEIAVVIINELTNKWEIIIAFNISKNFTKKCINGYSFH